MSETQFQFQDFVWIDLANPSPEALHELAGRYSLHPTSVQDCLQPEHLPKFETIEDVAFLVLRAHDPDSDKESGTVQELTRKLAIFYSESFVITIHRKHQPFLDGLREKWSKRGQNDPAMTPEHLLVEFFNEIVHSYQHPLMECLGALETFEAEVFHTGTHRRFRISKGYYVRRRVSVFKHMLRATLEPVNKVWVNAEVSLGPHFQNVKEQIDQLYYYAGDIEESLTALVNLHVSLQSQRTNEASRKTNEVMRVLTLFSCFFLPINFIASIYGMNFEHMPEIRWNYGYYFVLGIMTTVVAGIYFWFRKKGWLKNSPLQDHE